jgi:hypothetical protein
MRRGQAARITGRYASTRGQPVLARSSRLLRSFGDICFQMLQVAWMLASAAMIELNKADPSGEAWSVIARFLSDRDVTLKHFGVG